MPTSPNAPPAAQPGTLKPGLDALGQQLDQLRALIPGPATGKTSHLLGYTPIGGRP